MSCLPDEETVSDTNSNGCRGDGASRNSSNDMDRAGGDGESLNTLYKAMEMTEEVSSSSVPKSAEAAVPSVAASKPTTPLHGGTTPNTAPSAAVDEEAPAPPSQSPIDIMNAEEDETPFIWVLLDFARKRSWKKKLLTVLIVLSSVYVITDILFLGNVVPFVNSFLDWMTQHTVLGILVCVLFFAAATLVFVPHAILTFGVGWAFANVLGFGWGLIVGLFVSFMGSALGAILSFIRSRYMMRDLVELFAGRYPIVKATDRAIQRKGFKVCRSCFLIVDTPPRIVKQAVVLTALSDIFIAETLSRCTL